MQLATKVGTSIIRRMVILRELTRRWRSHPMGNDFRRPAGGLGIPPYGVARPAPPDRSRPTAAPAPPAAAVWPDAPPSQLAADPEDRLRGPGGRSVGLGPSKMSDIRASNVYNNSGVKIGVF